MSAFNRKITFSFADDTEFTGFTDDTYWNGFINVEVEPEEFVKICTWFDSECPGEDDPFYDVQPQVNGRFSLAGGFATQEVAA